MEEEKKESAVWMESDVCQNIRSKQAAMDFSLTSETWNRRRKKRRKTISSSFTGRQTDEWETWNRRRRRDDWMTRDLTKTELINWPLSCHGNRNRKCSVFGAVRLERLKESDNERCLNITISDMTQFWLIIDWSHSWSSVFSFVFRMGMKSISCSCTGWCLIAWS